MAFYISIGYSFALDPSIAVDGSVLLCGKMPMHQLERRQFHEPPVTVPLCEPRIEPAGVAGSHRPDDLRAQEVIAVGLSAR